LLFYGLSQAGRAVAAAAVTAQSDGWVLKGHGIKARQLTAPLPDITVVADPPSGEGSFVRLSLILDSPLWTTTEAPALHKLWDLLPELQEKPLRSDDSRRAPLHAMPYSPHEGHQLVGAQISGLPSWLSRIDVTRADFDAFMESYPSAAGYTVVVRQDGVPQYERDFNADTVGVVMHWKAGPTYPVPEEVRSQRLDAALTVYREGGYWLFPATIPGKRPLHPMMSWWAVLYALSMLARYQPAEWAACIDINTSPYANSVEYLLEEARTTVPDLIRTALGQVVSL
jgi:hypothetical protein